MLYTNADNIATPLYMHNIFPYSGGNKPQKSRGQQSYPQMHVVYDFLHSECNSL